MPPTTSKTMRLDESLITQVQKMADREDRSFANMVSVLLKEAIAQRESK